MSEIQKSIKSNFKLKDYWYQHFQNYQRSNLSKSAYVREHKISKNRFMYWSRKFELASPSSNQDVSDGFVAVKMKSESSKKLNPILCTMQLGDHQILIHDITALSSIIQLLR
jgi:hypothetical protein